jgi:MOSC domain-containing protein YiiM
MAVYAFSKKHYAFFQNQYPNITLNNGVFGENLTIDDLNEKTVFIGDTFSVGEAIIQVSQPRLPCKTLNAVFQTSNMMKLYINTTFSGAYFRVLQEGFVKKEDPLFLIEQAKDSLSLASVFSLFTTNKSNFDLIKKALELDVLSEKLKRDIHKKLL